MPTYQAERELLAPRADVWAFLAEPFNLPDWWPGIGGLQPDRRGLAPGARWQIVGENRPSLFRRPNMSGTLLVLAVEPYSGSRSSSPASGSTRASPIGASAGPDARPPDRSGPALVGLKRSMPEKALTRLHALVQTAADL